MSLPGVWPVSASPVPSPAHLDRCHPVCGSRPRGDGLAVTASSLGLCSQLLLVLLSSAGEPPLLAHSRHRWPFIQTQTPFLPGELLNLS